MTWEEYIRSCEAQDRFRAEYLRRIQNVARAHRFTEAMRNTGSPEPKHDSFETAKPVTGRIIDEP